MDSINLSIPKRRRQKLLMLVIYPRCVYFIFPCTYSLMVCVRHDSLFVGRRVGGKPALGVALSLSEQLTHDLG